MDHPIKQRTDKITSRTNFSCTEKLSESRSERNKTPLQRKRDRENPSCWNLVCLPSTTTRRDGGVKSHSSCTTVMEEDRFFAFVVVRERNFILRNGASLTRSLESCDINEGWRENETQFGELMELFTERTRASDFRFRKIAQCHHGGLRR